MSSPDGMGGNAHGTQAGDGHTKANEAVDVRGGTGPDVAEDRGGAGPARTRPGRVGSVGCCARFPCCASDFTASLPSGTSAPAVGADFYCVFYCYYCCCF